MTENYKKRLTGRPPKVDPCTHCVMVRFNDEEYEEFMARYRQSGVYAKAVFMKEVIFGKSFRVIVGNEEMQPYCDRLYDYHARFRSIATAYNLLVKEMHLHFSERRTMAILRNLEKDTTEMSGIAREVIGLAYEVRDRENEQEKHKNA